STFGVGYPGTQIDSAAGTASPAGQSAGSGSTAAAPQSPRAALDSALEHDPLRMAQLAFEAGMLVEPEELSAWTLYNRALEINPGSTAARQGLESIADELLKRASVAADQGRFDDARAAIARVRSAIPAHPGASDLSFRIDALATMAESDAGADEADSI